MRRLLGSIPLLAVLTLGITLTACGGAAAAPQGAGDRGFTGDVVAQQVEITADPAGALRWDKAEYTAAAGDVTFVVRNPGPVAHQFGVEGNGVAAQSANFSGNTAKNYTLRGLQPGEYRIVCNFPGHKEAGMVARLIVR